MTYPLTVLTLALCLALLAMSVNAAEHYVAPEGAPTGSGTVSAPYSLTTALSGAVGAPGDTFWLRGGTYRLGHLDTRIEGAPGAPITFRQVPGETARIDGSFSVFDSAGYVVFRDFELYSSDTNRVSSVTNAGFSPPDLTLYPGIGCYAPNLSFINLVIHDQTRHGIYASEHSSNNVIYGCIIYNNGWASPDNAEGHGLYIQGMGGIRKISDSLIFNNSGANVHVYENSAGKSLVGVTLEGNVAFNAGGIQNLRTYRDWVVGVDAPSDLSDQIILTRNMCYRLPTSAAPPEIQVGREGFNGTVVLTDNYFPVPLEMNNWSIAVVMRNLFSAQGNTAMVNYNQSLTTAFGIWDNNQYVSESGEAFGYNQEDYTFSQWQALTGFDGNSVYVDGRLSGTKVFIRTNAYEAQRAHLIIYNWDNLETVGVNVGTLLPASAVYEVRNAQDFSGPPVLMGVYDGQPLQLPMRNFSVAPPTGGLTAAPSTAPTFNVFVLLSSRIKLDVKQLGGFLQVSWPTNYGSRTLLYNSSLTGSSGWAASTNRAYKVGSKYIVTEPATPGGRFYRLQI